MIFYETKQRSVIIKCKTFWRRKFLDYLVNHVITKKFSPLRNLFADRNWFSACMQGPQLYCRVPGLSTFLCRLPPLGCVASAIISKF